MTVSAETEGFPVHWDDPADAELHWNHDPGRHPNVIKPKNNGRRRQSRVDGLRCGHARTGRLRVRQTSTRSRSGPCAT